jgi:glycosyltransferase involved in cell wall biosynthesis
MDKHRQKSYPAPGRTVILGWTGLKDNLGYMEIIAKVLRELAARHDLKLEVASGADYHLEGVRVENRRWTIEHEFDYLEDADIGLMPLKDTPRARGKCAFKALQYMGVGTPVVISPVGMNADVIEDGVTGFLADTPEEWRQKLEALITQPELRERMGRAAREMVLGRYSHEANYPKFKQMLETVAALRRQGPG